MGVWAQPFETVELAQKFAALVSKETITKEKDHEAIYEVAGCDELWDEIDFFVEKCGQDANLKKLILKHVEDWLRLLDMFHIALPEAVDIVGMAIMKETGKKFISTSIYNPIKKIWY